MKPKCWKSKIISIITIASFSIISNKLIIENIPPVSAIVEQTAIASAQLNLSNDDNLISCIKIEDNKPSPLSVNNSNEINDHKVIKQFVHQY